MSPLADKLKVSFGTNKDYRHGYVDEFLNAYIATQIKVLREQHDWTQQQLADQAGMKQGRISVMENVNYSSWSINTLRRLAEAFDLTLNVSFEDFGKRLVDIDRFSRESLERFSFTEDPVFQHEEVTKLLGSFAAREGLKPSQDNLLNDGNVYFMRAFRAKKDAKKEQEHKDVRPPLVNTALQQSMVGSGR